MSMSVTRFLILSSFFISLVSCKQHVKSPSDVDIKDTLRINLSSEPPSLDWQKSSDTTSTTITRNLMEGLVQYDWSSQEPKLAPGLATSWESSKDLSKWTFHIRPGVKWSDGKEFTAQQIIDAWERLLNSATASQYSYFLFPIKNARAYNEGKIKDFKKVGVHLSGTHDIVVELDAPRSYFPFLLTHHSTWPIRKDVIDRYGDRWTLPANMVTLGAFKLKSWQHDKLIVLQRNENYYGEKTQAAHVAFYIINEGSTAVNLFDTGALDVVLNLPSKDIPSLSRRPEYRAVSVLAIYYYGFNVTKPPMNNPLVRRAIAHAIDRQEITTLLGGGRTPISGWVPPGVFSYEEAGGLEFNPAKAKSLLEQAGYKKPSDFPHFALEFSANEDNQRIAENIQTQLKRNLGIQLALNSEESKSYLSRLHVDPPMMFRLGWQADYPDPDNFFTVMASYSENNVTRWKNLKFDELIREGARLMDGTARKEVYQKAQKLLIEQDTPVIPIFAHVSHKLISKRVENYPLNSLGEIDLKKVKLVQ